MLNLLLQLLHVGLTSWHLLKLDEASEAAATRGHLRRCWCGLLHLLDWLLIGLKIDGAASSLAFEGSLFLPQFAEDLKTVQHVVLLLDHLVDSPDRGQLPVLLRLLEAVEVGLFLAELPVLLKEVDGRLDAREHVRCHLLLL